MTTITEAGALDRWHAQIGYPLIRAIETPLPLVNHKGGRLRGVDLGDGIYLARDRRFYEAREGLAVELTREQVLARVNFHALVERFAGALRARLDLRRRQSRRLERILAGAF